MFGDQFFGECDRLFGERLLVFHEWHWVNVDGCSVHACPVNGVRLYSWTKYRHSKHIIATKHDFRENMKIGPNCSANTRGV